MQRVVIIHQSRLPHAPQVAEQLGAVVMRQGGNVTVHSSWDQFFKDVDLGITDLIISVGGDGTILRIARAVASWKIPILGVNMGRLGFITEIEAEEAADKLPLFLEGRGWVEERTMVEVRMGLFQGVALNEAVVSRDGPVRTVQIAIRVNGEVMTTYRGDGAIVATATGSTAYALSAGGPVLEPESRGLVVKPLSPHLALDRAMVVEGDGAVDIQVGTDHGAVLSLDGQEDVPVSDGAVVTVRRSPHAARFLRLRPRGYFYAMAAGLLSKAIPVPPSPADTFPLPTERH